MKDLPLSPFDRLNNKLDRGERYVSCPKTQEVETAKGSTQELYNHLKTTYGTPRFGTTRAVFKVDAHTVIKLAFVERGLEQNQNEIAMAAYTSTVDLRDHDFLQHFEVADGKVPTAPTRVKHTHQAWLRALLCCRDLLFLSPTIWKTSTKSWTSLAQSMTSGFRQSASLRMACNWAFSRSLADCWLTTSEEVHNPQHLTMLRVFFVFRGTAVAYLSGEHRGTGATLR